MEKKKIKLVIRVILLVGTVISLYFVPWILVKAYLLPLPETVNEQLNEAIDLGFDGIITYVDKGGEEPLFYAAGMHNKEKKIPANPKALFKIASISKLYTAVAITKLVSKGKLSLDKTVADYFPEVAGRIENADKITLRMLVQHRSGIPNFTDTKDYWAAPKETYEEKLNLILDLPSNFEPGEDYEYCNTNYLLLSKLIEKKVGYSKFRFIKEEILEPLGLNHTFSSIKEVNIEDVMSGYHVGHPFDLKTDDIGMVAAAEDVGKFIRALNVGSLLNKKEREIYSSIYVYKHGGWVPGYQSFAEYHKDIDTVVVQFTNTTDPKLYNWNLSQIIYSRIMKILRKS